MSFIKSRSPCRLIAGATIIAIVAGLNVALPTAGADEPASDANTAPLFSGKNMVRTTAIVLGVDAKRNRVMLWDDNGQPVEVAVDRMLGDVSRLGMGDEVNITYNRALLLRADGVEPGTVRKRIDSDVTTSASTGNTLSLHRVEAVATVIGIDRSQQRFTLRGTNQIVTLQASSPAMLEKMKVGDNLKVDFIEAVAVHITRDGRPLR